MTLPMTMPNLRQIAELCLRGEPLGQDLGRPLGTALVAFIEHRARSLEEAMGLLTGRGGVSWWIAAAIGERDAALRTLAVRFWPAESVAAQARRIYVLSLRYAASAWRHDKNIPTPPAHYADTPHLLLWHAFKSGARMPLGERQLRNILRR
jgi:hypothetical protein